MRLSPTSVFLALVALGLPVAVALGWHFAGPATAPSLLEVPGGAGGIGTAPIHPTTSAPVTPVDWSPPARAAAAKDRTAAPAPSPPASASPSAPPPAAGHPSRSAPPSTPLPSLSPPTDPTGPPPSMIVIPSESDAPEEFDLNTARLVRRP